MKVTPSNQSLILAGEPPFGRASRLVASGTASKRVTILRAHLDAAVTASRPASTSFYRDPIQLYARTQRSLEDTPNAALVDVFA